MASITGNLTIQCVSLDELNTIWNGLLNNPNISNQAKDENLLTITLNVDQTGA